ncbi:MAG: 4-(cytidine 5'-diphospho)-2-C-methyl-D-erythritol kinase [Duncaniella sp.]|nr:4-(cytidine 5'-diphospho)-2-C-methyl-D-erythritol kinase [Duncaniella sp.]
MITFPNAKINLGLDILRRRPDGYHDISTVMVPVPWTDILEVVPARGGETTLTVSGRPVDCPPEKNLVMKAYRALAQRVRVPELDLYLRKIIPDGAGLGGGSADASFLLTALRDMLELPLSDNELAGIAATLGADCPFFVHNRPMLCTGTGTEMTPIEITWLDSLGILIVKPPVSVPTAQAYARVTPAEPEMSVEKILALPPSQWQGLLKNDFEPSVFAAYPEVARVKERILSLEPVYASMSGSGASVYGLFGSDKMADLTTDAIAPLFDGCDTFIGMLGRS